MAKRIQNVEIFATGKHRGSEELEITEDDLTEMVNSFNALGDKEGFRPVLKLGHSDAQKFFGDRKGSPNLGFVEKIWKVGGKILADFINVPDALVDLIGQRRYNSVSIEMFPKTEVGGATFTNVLTAVALIGAELPAVKGLKELAATLFTEEPAYHPDFTGDALKLETSEKDNMFNQEQVDALIAAAEAKAVAETKATFEAKATEADAKVAAAETAKKTAEDALRQYEVDTHTKTSETMVDDAIKAGKLTPAQKPEALAFALSLSGTVKFGDKEKSSADVFKSFLDGMPAKVDLDEHGNAVKVESKPESAGDEIDLRAKKLLAEKKAETYADARTMVLDQNPELKQRYFEMEE